MVWDAVAPAERSKIALFSDLLDRVGEARIRVSGSSMLPAIWPGDILTIRRCGVREARCGDIALFARDGRLFAHRVVARDGDRLVTRGDSVPSPDAPVSGAELLGVARAIARGGRPVAAPGPMGVTGRLVAAAVRRSSTASRILQRGRALRDRLGVS